jgi:hypothetical protein
MHIGSDNNPQTIADKHFTLKCPHCNTRSGVSLVAAPRYEYLHRFRPDWVGLGYRCDACNEPVFLKFRINTFGNPVHLDEQPVEIQRAAETFELSYLPPDVGADFAEALTCYSQSSDSVAHPGAPRRSDAGPPGCCSISLSVKTAEDISPDGAGTGLIRPPR